MNLPDVLLKQQPSIVERHRTRGVGGWGGRDRDRDGGGRGREAAKEREQKDRATAALRQRAVLVTCREPAKTADSKKMRNCLAHLFAVCTFGSFCTGRACETGPRAGCVSMVAV